ncbi:class I SAM-dependent methyltransferase [Litoreibacter roseus]|uniref:O-methyltransferase n=1 Tax=Litoreibacter roseus TaxID=2601869 RepID=A0A6N6JBH2_9RHOB|nr:class I SAM-dependent methyltransferase [Litoreibacter roseus]GFE63404.1 O-methyltransferase [Litoreibacter roseus]
MTNVSADHADLMDATYRHQRLIYDVTRKAFLLGRDHLISDLAPAEDSHVLEVACGTGRNLAYISARYPGCHLYGLDISEEMLTTARAEVGTKARLARADACTFQARALFGHEKFDRIILSYSLSMIPDWKSALAQSVRHLAPGGSVHVVDFGTQANLPRIFVTPLRRFLARFHVKPRDDLRQVLATSYPGRSEHQDLHRCYAQYGVIHSSEV